MTKISINISTNGQKRYATLTTSPAGMQTQSAGNYTAIWIGSSNSVAFTVGTSSTYGTDGSTKAGQLCFSSIDIEYEAPATTDPSKTSLDFAWTQNPLSVRVGQSVDIPATVTGADNAASLVNYTSGNTATASIAAGKIAGAAAGTTTITPSLTDQDNYQFSGTVTPLTVNVVKTPIVLEWSKASDSYKVGDSATAPTLSATIDGSAASDAVKGLITYSLKAGSTDGIVNIADNGKSFSLSTSSAGSATIVASIPASDATYTATAVEYTINVSKHEVTLAWPYTPLSIKHSESFTAPAVTATVDGSAAPSSVTDLITFSLKAGSADGIVNIAAGGKSFSIDNTKIGSATIVASIPASDATYTATAVEYTVTVAQHDATLSWATDATTTFNKGTTASNPTLTATPSEALANVVYSTDNASIVTIADNGKSYTINTAAEGSATITASFPDGDKYKASPAAISINVFDPNRLTATLNWADHTSKWQSTIDLTPENGNNVFKDGPVSFTFEKNGASNPPRYMNSTTNKCFRIYKAGYLTIDVPRSHKITSITFTDLTAGFKVDGVDITSDWTAPTDKSVKSVQFDVTANNVSWTSITVYYAVDEAVSGKTEAKLAWNSSDLNVRPGYTAPTLSATVAGSASPDALAAVRYSLSGVNGDIVTVSDDGSALTFDTAKEGSATITAEIPADNASFYSNIATIKVSVAKTVVTLDWGQTTAFGDAGTTITVPALTVTPAEAASVVKYTIVGDFITRNDDGSFTVDSSKKASGTIKAEIPADNPYYSCTSLQKHTLTVNVNTKSAGDFRWTPASTTTTVDAVFDVPTLSMDDGARQYVRYSADPANSPLVTIAEDRSSFTLNSSATGTVTIKAEIPENDVYTARTAVNHKFTVNKNTLTLAWSAAAPKVNIGGTPPTLTLTQAAVGEAAPEPLPSTARVVYSADPANSPLVTIAEGGSSFTLNTASAGSVTVTATISTDDPKYTATPVSTVYTVAKLTSTLAWTATDPVELKVDDTAPTVSLSLSNADALSHVTFSSTNADVAKANADGSLTISTANAGTATVTASIASDNPTFNAASASITVNVSKHTVTLAWDKTADEDIPGSTVAAPKPVIPDEVAEIATITSDKPEMLSVGEDGRTITVNTATAGTGTLTLAIPETDRKYTASPAVYTLTIGKVTPVITWVDEIFVGTIYELPTVSLSVTVNCKESAAALSAVRYSTDNSAVIKIATDGLSYEFTGNAGFASLCASIPESESYYEVADVETLVEIGYPTHSERKIDFFAEYGTTPTTLTDIEQKFDKVTITCTKGTNTDAQYYYTAGETGKHELRIYKGSTMTVSVPAGYYISEIVSTYGATTSILTVDTGTLGDKALTWTPTSLTNSVVFTSTTGTRGWETITVKYFPDKSVAHRKDATLTWSNSIIELETGKPAALPTLAITVDGQPDAAAVAAVVYSTTTPDVVTIAENGKSYTIDTSKEGNGNITASIPENNSDYSAAPTTIKFVILDPARTDRTFDFPSYNKENNTPVNSLSEGRVTLAFGKGENANTIPVFYGGNAKVYSGNSLTVSVTEGYCLSRIVFVKGTADPGISKSTHGAYSAAGAEWNSNGELRRSVTLKTGAGDWKSITVYYQSSSFSAEGAFTYGNMFIANKNVNTVTFNPTLYMADGSPAGETVTASFDLRLDGQSLGACKDVYEYFDLRPAGTFTLVNGDLSIPVAVKWPSLDPTPEIKKVRYWEDDDTKAESPDYYFINADYYLGPKTNTDGLHWMLMDDWGNFNNSWHDGWVRYYIDGVGTVTYGVPDPLEDIYPLPLYEVVYPYAVRRSAPAAAPGSSRAAAQDPEFEIRLGRAAEADRPANPLTTLDYPEGQEPTIGNVSAVSDVTVDTDSQTRYFNLQGLELHAPLAPGAYIRLQGGKSQKVVVR